MIYLYKADDGTIFEDEFECGKYEFDCFMKTINIIVLDKNGNRLNDIETDETYNKSYKVIISNEDDLNAILKIREFMGTYLDIDSIGTWVYNDNIDKWICEKQSK